MGKLKGGIFGNLHGRIGNQVYYRLNGKTVVRKVGSISKPPTAKQLTCRRRVTVLSIMFKQIKAFIDVGFAAQKKGTTMSAYAAAMKYNLKTATLGDFPDVRIDYGKLLLSRGNLMGGDFAEVAKENEGLRFTWKYLEMPNSGPYDAVMILLYFPVLQEGICLLNAAQRKAETAFIALDAMQLEQEVQIYLAFAAECRNAVSNSEYLGCING